MLPSRLTTPPLTVLFFSVEPSRSCLVTPSWVTFPPCQFFLCRLLGNLLLFVLLLDSMGSIDEFRNLSSNGPLNGTNGADNTEVQELDALVVGAGFGGVYQLKVIRDAGYTVKLVECGTDYGGVWYWNRYPGARVRFRSLSSLNVKHADLVFLPRLTAPFPIMNSPIQLFGKIGPGSRDSLIVRSCVITLPM